MAKKQPAGPSLFGDTEPAAPGAYPAKSRTHSLSLAASTGGIARAGADLGEPVAIVGPEITGPDPVMLDLVADYRGADAQRIAELEEAVRRAIGFIRQEMFETAKVVLEEVVGA